MLGEIPVPLSIEYGKVVKEDNWVKCLEIIEIGGEFNDQEGNFMRMIYYAERVLEQNLSHICEIGGGVGQFYAVLRALGYRGKYYIYDLEEVKRFQRKYLDEVTRRTGLETSLEFGRFDYCVSFYAYGEFDDDLKAWYTAKVITKTPHGLIIFNPHSGSSSEIPFECKVEDEYPLTSPGNKMLTW